MSSLTSENLDVFNSHYCVVDDFLPAELAQAMRQDIDKHFAKPHSHQPQSHQVWNYWHVQGLYTYMRTLPDKIIHREYMDQFMAALGGWAAKTLGMRPSSRPYLSMYVSGCRQGLHNDAKGGNFAFVYSLTKNERKSSGGETRIFNEGDLFQNFLTRPAAANNYYTDVAPRFNRLAIFDDRIPHGVERVDGSMDPLEGRFVLHGHIIDDGPIVEGALSPDTVGDAVVKAMERRSVPLPNNIAQHHGPLVIRFTIGSDGTVQSVKLIVDRVIGPRGKEWDNYSNALLETRREIRFPPSKGITTITEPVMFGAPAV
jgi:hypothetical protein